ncbi:MAG: CsbD family protein [Pseudanabaena sp. CAN_BIN31]|nr:CsbD family protein [Pseudanabaena sp. CAN_BIN31]
MISQIYRSLLTIGLSVFFSFALVFGFNVENSWAAGSFTQLINFPRTPIASMERVNAATKDLEGKAQDAIGNVTGSRKNQVAGKAKQVEAKTRNSAEDTKDRMKTGAKNLEGKTQEAIGNVTGDREDQVAGKAKQAESKTRNLIENATDKVKGMFD